MSETGQKPFPLCVDLDGTLIQSDLLHASMLRLIKHNPLYVCVFIFWFLQGGKQRVKREAAQYSPCEPSKLPYNTKFLSYLNNEIAGGRKLILATSADEKEARRIADYLGIFDEVFSTNSEYNLGGKAKKDALVRRFGEKGFDYAGNSAADLHVWAHARKAIFLGTNKKLLKQCKGLGCGVVDFQEDDLEEIYGKNIRKSETEDRCWACGSNALAMVRKSNWTGQVNETTFAITNSDYGVTGDIARCGHCGFMQCSSVKEVLKGYEDLVDPAFDETRASRSVQERKLLEYLRRVQPQGKLLDIGAASGAMVEQALAMGYLAEGVEPSKWLQMQAQQRGLPVHLGTLPHSRILGPYDAICMVDVIEHVPQPYQLIAEAARLLSEKGVILVVTPDAKSLAARCLGWKWWHYRLAHVGYFNRRSLDAIFGRAGFRKIASGQPVWYFDLDYLAERIKRYLPKFLHFNTPRLFKKIVVPINLFDSLLCLYAKHNNK